jgi:hypothetical protein
LKNETVTAALSTVFRMKSFAFLYELAIIQESEVILHTVLSAVVTVPFFNIAALQYVIV